MFCESNLLFVLEHPLNDAEQAFEDGISRLLFAFKQLDDILFRLGIGCAIEIKKFLFGSGDLDRGLGGGGRGDDRCPSEW